MVPIIVITETAKMLWESTGESMKVVKEQIHNFKILLYIYFVDDRIKVEY